MGVLSGLLVGRSDSMPSLICGRCCRASHVGRVGTGRMDEARGLGLGGREEGCICKVVGLEVMPSALPQLMAAGIDGVAFGCRFAGLKFGDFRGWEEDGMVGLLEGLEVGTRFRAYRTTGGRLDCVESDSITTNI